MPTGRKRDGVETDPPSDWINGLIAAAPAADAADALACAICHAHGGQGLGALATAGYRVRGGRLIG